ncbi:MAG: hypothetical protein LBI34_02100 [Puniceicoccales bacterium]|jgi:hypothetical protein|nr:hypothetical protein [Puniceicoccales bacterium]
MAIQIITLRQVFDQIFAGKNTVDYAALCAMMDTNDTFNRDAYSIDESFSSIEAAKSNYEFTLDAAGNFSGFVLYSRTMGPGGKHVLTQVTNPDTRVPSSVELYLKDKWGRLVQVYALRQLNCNKFFIQGTNKYSPYYSDISARAAAILYARSCSEKKAMELHLHDIEVVNMEQMEVNTILSILASIKNDLSQLDVAAANLSQRTKRQMDAVALAFFSTRGLLDNLTQCSGLTTSGIADLRKILVGEDTAGKLGKPYQATSIGAFIQNYRDDRRLWGDASETDLSVAALSMALQYLCREDSISEESEDFYSDSLSDDISSDPAMALDILRTVFYTHEVAPILSHAGTAWELVVENNSETESISSARLLGNSMAHISDDDDSIDRFISLIKNGGTVYFTYRIQNVSHRTAQVSHDQLLTMRTVMELFTAATEALTTSEESDGSESLFDELVDSLRCTVIGDANASSEDDQNAIHVFYNMLLPYFDVGYGVETVDSTGDYTLGLINSFKAWVYLHALLKHYKMFMIDKSGTINGVENCDVYDPKNWQKVSEIATNARIGMAGIGEHWVFAGDKSIRWFGRNPPSGAEDFEIGTAGLLARPYGGISFINGNLFTRNNNGQMVFTEEFKSALQNANTTLAVHIVNTPNSRYFYVSFQGQEARYGGSKIADLTVRNYNPGEYWNIGISGDAYSKFFVGPSGGGANWDNYDGINAKAQSISLNGEDYTFWQDTGSLYTSQIGSDSSTRLSAMQSALQSSQQSLSQATNLSKRIGQIRQEVTANTR